MTDLVRIGDVAEIHRGTIAANTTDIIAGPGFFGLAEIANSGVVTRSPEPGADLERAFILRRDDIVVALLGKLGQAAIVTADAAGSILGRECAAVRVKAGEQRVEARWLFAALRSSQLRDRAQVAASGSTMPRLSVKSLADFTITMPTRRAQAEAIERFDLLEKAIVSQAQLLQSLNALFDAEIELAVAGHAPDKDHGDQTTLKLGDDS